MFRNRGDNSSAVFSILLVLLCAFHDPKSASFCRLGIRGTGRQQLVKEKPFGGVAVVSARRVSTNQASD